MSYSPASAARNADCSMAAVMAALGAQTAPASSPRQGHGTGLPRVPWEHQATRPSSQVVTHRSSLSPGWYVWKNRLPDTEGTWHCF